MTEEQERRLVILEKHIDVIQTRLNNVENMQTRTDERYNNIMREIEKMSVTLEDLKNKPAKNWGVAVSAAISAIVSALIGLLIKGGF